VSHYEPNPDDQYAATTLDRSVFDEEAGAGGVPVKIAAPNQQGAAAPAAAVPAPQRRVAPPSESDFGLKVALVVVAVLVVVLVVFLVSLILAG